MPELPEVETIRRDLEPLLKGVGIRSVFVQDNRVIKEPRPKEFIAGIEGAKFQAVGRRGKLLFFKLIKNRKQNFLTVHLRMTGQLIYASQDIRARVAFGLDNGCFLNYCDQRILGELRLVDDWHSLGIVQRMGPDPLDPQFSLPQFQRLLSGRKAKIKPLLMDQNFLAGIGNIYASEALFLSGIDPAREAASLTKEESGRLFKSIRQVLRLAIRCRGTSFSDYRDGKGAKGTFVHKLKVYGRKDAPCPACGQKIKRTPLGGRSTFYCERCQR